MIDAFGWRGARAAGLRVAGAKLNLGNLQAPAGLLSRRAT